MRRVFAVLGALGLVFAARDAHAIRPFVTDDARVVGEAHLQLETYWRRDRESAQHWLLPAVGPTDWLKLTLGAVHGVNGFRAYPDEPKYAIAGPLLQGKILLRETVPNRPPGLALALGGITGLGRGGFEPPGESGFAYLAATQAFFKEDDFLVHMNVGVAAVNAEGFPPARFTYGIGTQVETVFDFHLIGEIYSGDPYIPGSGGSYQLGFRQIYNDHLQLDFTFGGGLWGDVLTPPFVSSGLRIVSHELW